MIALAFIAALAIGFFAGYMVGRWTEYRWRLELDERLADAAYDSAQQRRAA